MIDQMFELPGEAKIQCFNCECIFYVSGWDIGVECIGSNTRSIGEEYFYGGTSSFNCPNCTKYIEITYEASEYPEGVLNYSDIDAHNADVISGFGDIDVSFEDEIYHYDEKSTLYLPEEKKILTCLESGTSNLISEILKDSSVLYKIQPREFEEIIAIIFSKHGFEVQLTKKTRDGGRDIIALRSDLGIRSKYLIECKRYAINCPVRIELVRNLYGVQMQEGANKSVLATTSYFTQEAKKFASASHTTEWAMDLRDKNDILEWLQNTSFN